MAEENKNLGEEIDSMDDLLNLTDDDLPSPPKDDVPEEEQVTVFPESPSDDPLDIDQLDIDPLPSEDISTETEHERRVRELQAQIEEAENLAAVAEDDPDRELTPEEVQIRELEDQLARKRAAALEAAPMTYDRTQGKETILIHFLANGFSAQEVVWQRGQELEFVVGSEAHKQTFDRSGRSWLDLRNDPAEQYRIFGREYFREGPFPFTPLGDVSGITDPDDIAALEKAAAEERKRNRAAPVIRT